MNKNQLKELKTKSKQIEYNFLRSSPKIESLVEACSKGELSKTEFAFIGDEPKKQTNLKVKGGNLFGGDSNDEDLPPLIVFVVGGLAHNEICALEKLQGEKKLSHNLVMGSTHIMNAKDYVNELNDLILPSENYDGKHVELKSIELVIID
jgi:hypothetical protein